MKYTTQTEHVADDDELIDKRELAARLKRSVRTIDKYMAAGRLTYIKLSPKTVRFRWNDVLRKLSDYRVN
jgi:DNA-binding CsgD family transcriptional regulator